MRAAGLHLILVFLVSCGSLFGQHAKAMIPVSSELYWYLDTLYIEAGRTVVNTARPWSYDEFYFQLNKIVVSSLSPAGRQLQQRLLGMVTPSSPQGFSAAIDVLLKPEIFTHLHLQSSAVPADAEYQWQHGYMQRSPLLEIPLEFFLRDSLYLLIHATIKEERDSVIAGNYSNLVFDDPGLWVDAYFPFTAYTASGGPNWSFLFGRNQYSWGNGRSGNLILGNVVNYIDGASLAFWGDTLKFSTLYAAFEDAYGLTDSNPPQEFNSGYQAFLGHRLDIQVHPKVSLALFEALMFGGEPGNLVQDLNFAMIFHNWNDIPRMNSIFSVEANINPWNYCNLYGQFALDEFATKYEADLDGGGGPAVYGWLAGLDLRIPLDKAYLSFVTEYAYTSPWLYNRRQQPYFYATHRYWSMTNTRNGAVSLPLGYTYGSDAVVWYNSLQYRLPGKASLALNIEYRQQGEKGYLSSWQAAEGDTAPMSPAPVKTTTVHIATSYQLLGWLSLQTNLYYIHSSNYLHIAGSQSQDMELSLLAAISSPWW